MFGFPLFEFMLLVFGFGFLIFVHELGHFMVAKWVGIRCPQFAIGFGHAIVAWRKGVGFRRGSTEPEYQRRAIEKLKQDGIKPAADGPHQGTTRYDDIEVPEEHESEYTGKQIFAVTDAMGLGQTEYRLNWLPLGGYVKMLGQEDMDPNAQSDDPSAYNNKPIRSRAAVISAGVVMNVIFGVIFLMAAFMIGVHFPTATVGGVVPTMPAAATFADGHDGDLRYLGLQPGDVILKVNGKKPVDFTDVVIATALGKSGSAVTLEVDRLGEGKPLTYTLVAERSRSGERLLSAGLSAGQSLEVIGAKEDTEFAEWADGREQMVISQVSGSPITSFAEVLYAIREAGGQPVEIQITDPLKQESTLVSLPAVPTLCPSVDGNSNLAGLMPAIRVSNLSPKSPAQKAGILEGDILVRVGDLQWPGSFAEVIQTVTAADGEPVRVVVLRDGQRVEIGDVSPKKNLLGIGIEPVLDQPLVSRAIEGSPAAALGGDAGFMPGSRIVSVGGNPVNDWADIQRQLTAVNAIDDQTASVRITYTLPTTGNPIETGELVLDRAALDDLQAASWTLGEADFGVSNDLKLLQAQGVGDAFLIGMDKTKDFILQTYITLLRLVQGDVKIYNLRGPVGIVDVGTRTAQQGFPYLLYFLGLISINLAVINFLPIPIVDGGHMVFLLIEKVTGSPPSPKVHAASLYVGLALIGFVFLTTLFYDVTRLIGL